MRSGDYVKQENWIDELLPCPFCGNTELRGPHFSDYIGDSYYPQWYIDCDQCPCGMHVDGESSSGVIDAWNKRI